MILWLVEINLVISSFVEFLKMSVTNTKMTPLEQDSYGIEVCVCVCMYVCMYVCKDRDAMDAMIHETDD